MSSKGSGDFPINISVTQTGLDQVTAQLTRFSEILKTTGSTMQQQVSQINSLGTAFSNFGKSATGLNTGVTQAANGLKQLSPAATQAGSSIAQTQTKMTAFMDATKIAGTSATQAANGIKAIGPAAQQAGSAAGSAAAQLNNVSNAERLTGEAAMTAANGFKEIGTAMTSASTSLGTATGRLETFDTSLTETNSLMNTAIANTQRYASVLNMNSEATTANTTANESNAATAGKATEAHSQLGNSLLSNVKHASALGLGFMMLSNTGSDMSLVQGNIAQQTEKVTEAQKKAAAALQQYGKDSKQYQQAQEAVAKAQRGLQYEQREYTAQLHNQLFMQGMIVMEIVGDVLPALVHLQSTVKGVKDGFAAFQTALQAMPSKFSKLFDGLTNALSLLPGKFGLAKQEAMNLEQAVVSNTSKTGIFSGALTSLGGILQGGAKDLSATGNATKLMAAETGGATIAMEGAGIASRGLLATLGPIGIALAAVATVITLVATNAFGFRDSMEQAGVAVGNAVPVLAPFLEGLQGIAAQLGLTGESADQAKAHLDNATFGFQHMSTLWNDTVANMQASNNVLVKSMGDTAAVLGVDMNKAMGDLQNQVKATTTTWGLFVDALKKGDYKGAVDIIASSFAALPGIFSRIFSDVQNTLVDFNTGLTKAFDYVATTIKNTFQNDVLPAVVGIAKEIGTRFMAALTAAFEQVASWATANIVTPIQNTVNGIASGIQEVGKAVWTKLGLDQLVAFAVPMVNNLATAISNVANFVKEAATQAWIKLNLMAMIVKAVPLVSALGQGISNVAKFVANEASAVWDALHLNDLLDSATKLGQGIANNISAGLKGVIELMNNIGNTVGGALGAAGKAITDFGKNPSGLGQANGQTTPGQQQQTAQQPISSVSPPKSTTKTPWEQEQDKVLNQGAGGSNSTSSATTTPQSGTQSKAGYQQAAYTTQVPTITSSGNDSLVAGLQKQKQALNDVMTATQQAAAVAKAYGDQQKAAGDAVTELSTKNDKLQTTIVGNSLALGQNKLQSELARQGYLGQSDALQKLEMDNISNQAALIAFNQQLASGEMQGAAFTNAVLTQELALKKNEQAVSDLQGTTAAMTDEYLRGESGVNQYNLAFEEQRQIFATNLTEGQKLHGTLDALNEGIVSHIATVEAFNKGYEQQKIDTANAAIAISEYQGKLIALGQDMQSGEAIATAYMNGILKTRESLLNNVIATAEARGGIDEMNAALSTGLPQWTAFTQGMLDAQKADQDYQLSLDKTIGNLEYLNQHLTDTNNAVNQYKTGFAQAATEVAGWVQKINEGTGAIDGHAKEVEYLANLYHVTLPEGFNFTQQQFDDWVKAAMGDNDLLSKSFADSAKAGADMIQQIADNFKNGKVDLGKAVKELADETGLKFTGSLKDAVKPELVADAIKKPMTAGLNLIADIGTVGPAADAIVKQYTGMIADNIKKAPELATAGQSLMKILNDPERITDPAKWLFQLKEGLDAYGQGLTPATNSTADLQMAISSIADPAKQSSSSVAGLQTALNNYIKYGANSSKSTADLAAAFNQLGINGQGASELLAKLGITGPKAAQVLAEINSAANPAGAALTGVGTGASSSDPMVVAFTATLRGMMPIFGQIESVADQIFAQQLPYSVGLAASGIVANFGTIIPGIMPVLGSVEQDTNTAFQIISGYPIQFTTATNTAYKQGQGDALGYLNTMKGDANTAFQQIGASSIQVSTQVNTNYKTAENDSKGYLASMQKEGNDAFAAIGKSAVQVATGVNTAYKTAEGDAKGYLATLQKDSDTVFKAIASSANQVATGVNNAFRTAEGDAEGYLNSLRGAADNTFQDIVNRSNAAARAIDGIGNSARTATGAVNSLASAINSLHDKTVTIHVQQQGSVPGGFAGQFGLNMLVDKPTQFLAGEGFGKERVKIAPGTMGFVEDLSKELRAKFGHGQYSGTSSGLGGLGGMGAKISEWVNDFLENLFNSIGWPFPGHGGGGSSGGGGNNPPPNPQNINLSPNMLNAFGPFPVNSPHAWEQSNVITPQTTTLPPNGSSGGTGTGTGSGSSSGSSSGGSGGGGGNSGGSSSNTNTNNTNSQNNQSIIQTNTNSQISNIPGASNSNQNININTGSQSVSSSQQTSQGAVKVIRETSVPVTLELDGTPLMKTILKLISQEMSSAGVYG